MTEKEKRNVWYAIDNEGFDYCFRSYSSFDEITDPKFRKLYDKYCEAANKLEEYVKPKDAE